ncbi:MAG: hypothetical protein LBG52_01920 [Candidatus Peribacteria bacterium]|jgi:hypothetical protein|nr:hypothetical protein [Candidatus Peribacteria bacterium]
MLQAFASGWFNEYVMTRREKGLHLLGGDLVVDRHYATGANVGVYQEGMIQKFDYQKGKTLNESKGVREASELLYYSSLFYPSQWSPQRVST